jgi:hypothetical protein
MRIVLFRDQDHIRAIDAFQIYITRIETLTKSIEVILDQVSAFLEKITIKTIRAWGMIRWHLLKC